MAGSDELSLQIKASAAAWMARLRSEQRSYEDEVGFRAWLAEDRRHGAAFEMMNNVWDAARPMHRDLRGKIPSAAPRLSRRAMFGGVAAASLGGGFLLTQTAVAQVYKTEIGEQKHVLLRGAELFLDTDTKVTTAVFGIGHSAVLEYGRANFRLADPSRAFRVDVGRNIVVGTQSTFDVRRVGETASILVLQGQAAVELRQGDAAPKLLNQGERLIAAPASVRLDKPDLAPLLAWQTGQAIFRNDTLVEAAGEMNRYSTLRLEIADARIAGLRVSGIFRVGDNAIFAQALEKLLPVVVRQAGDRIELVGDAERMRQI